MPFFILFIFAAGGWAQTGSIRGRVVSSAGLPIAEVVVINLANGEQVTTDAEGNFVLNLDLKDKVTLDFVHVSYMGKEVTFSARELKKPVTVILAPYIRQKHEVVVTALRYPEPMTKIPAAGTLVENEFLAEGMAPNIAEALNGLPGTTPLGSGGFSLVPSIRGLARNRILLLIDNARIVSDRRTGPNASFVNPDDISKIEVLRSPSSIFYGSDAIGGVVHIFTKGPEQEGIHGSLRTSFGTNNQLKNYGMALTGKKNHLGFYLSYQGVDAENYASPLAEVLQSGFFQSSLFGKIVYETEQRRVDFSFLGARGKDIGKPAQDSATKPTWYPRENQNLAQLHWTEKNVLGGDLSLQAYANPNLLETRTNTITGYVAGESKGYVSKESFSRTESTEYGFQLSYGNQLTRGVRLTGGFDLFGRGAAKAVNQDTSFDSAGNTTKIFRETPFTKGRRGDLGFYISADYSGLRRLDLVGGIRWDRLTQSAHPGDAPEPLNSERDAFTGFLALSYKLTDQLVAFANLSRAYRVPGLSELFYTGITGRGFIIAQPGLKPETSLNSDIGLRLFQDRFFFGIYAFHYSIDNLIDRFLLSAKDKIYTYGNLDNGRIRGLELEFEYHPLSGWKVFGNIFALKGESRTTGMPLNDIPPLRLFIGSRVWLGKLSLELNGTFQRQKDKPGPAEIAIQGSEYFQVKAGYNWGPLRFYGLLSNVLNRTYLGRPDPAAMEEPGRDLVFGINYRF